NPRALAWDGDRVPERHNRTCAENGDGVVQPDDVGDRAACLAIARNGIEELLFRRANELFESGVALLALHISGDSPVVLIQQEKEIVIALDGGAAPGFL